MDRKHVVTKSGDTWTQTQKLVVNKVDANFGVSVAMAGRVLVVGANFSISQKHSQGAAYVFLNTNGVWNEGQRLTGSDSVTGDRFGSSVATNGSTILVNAPSKNTYAGEVYVFSRSDQGWTQTQIVTPSDNAPFRPVW